MTEAIHLHDELVQALQLLIPQTTYHDLRRLNTLAGFPAISNGAYED
jgi:hypothetical protein